MLSPYPCTCRASPLAVAVASEDLPKSSQDNLEWTGSVASFRSCPMHRDKYEASKADRCCSVPNCLERGASGASGPKLCQLHRQERLMGEGIVKRRGQKDESLPAAKLPRVSSGKVHISPGSPPPTTSSGRGRSSSPMSRSPEQEPPPWQSASLPTAAESTDDALISLYLRSIIRGSTDDVALQEVIQAAALDEIGPRSAVYSLRQQASRAEVPHHLPALARQAIARIRHRRAQWTVEDAWDDLCPNCQQMVAPQCAA